MFEINKSVRENIKRLSPYSCARDDYKGSSGIFLDANESPYGELNRYPDPFQSELKNAISGRKNVGRDNLFLGNGSDEIIDLIFRTFCNPGIDKVMIFPPTYGMYEVSASINDVGVIKIPLDDVFQINTKKVEPFFNDPNLKLIFICSPNNPTGNCMNSDDIDYLIRNSGSMVVIDEAYHDFCDKISFSNMIDIYPNLIVLQTFSKALGLAAVRIGIAYSNPAVIQYLNKIKPPYNISTINQEAALAKLAEGNIFANQIDEIKKERERLSVALSGISLTERVFPSETNFLLVKVKDARYIYNYLINNRIIVRNRSSIIDNCLRITVGTQNENNILINALREITI